MKRNITLENVLKEMKKRNAVAPLTDIERQAKAYEADQIAYRLKIREIEREDAQTGDSRLNSERALRRIMSRVTELETKVNQLANEAERGEAWKQFMAQQGIVYDPATRKITLQGGMTFNLGDNKLGLDPSQFFKNLGWLPVAQQLNKLVKGFPFQDFFPRRIEPHGTKLMYYEDYGLADTLPAYEVPEGADYVNKLFNTDITLAFEEQYRVYLDVHKGLKIPSDALNDFTTKESIFTALVGDIAYQVARPIARVFAQFQMEMLQNPKNLATGVDWDTLTPDVTITYNSGEDMVAKFAGWVKDQESASRSFQPEAWWPQGATQGLEIGMDTNSYRIIMDNKLDNYTNMYVKAPLYNQDNLAWGLEKYVVSFKNSFENYIGANTHQDQSSETGTFYAIVASPNSAEIMMMYEGSRTQELLVYFSVHHVYARYGDVWNKNYPVFLVKFVSASGKLPVPASVSGEVTIVGGGGGGQTFKTINSEEITGTGDIKLQVPLSAKAGETTLTGNVVALDPAITTKVNGADTLSKTNQTNIATINTNMGDVSTLATTAKTVVPAINEVNAKQPAGK